MKLSSTTLELSCKKSEIWICHCAWLHKMQRCSPTSYRFLNYIIYLRMLTYVVLGCLKNLRGGLGTTCMGQ